eukprot:Hpha_TRINITY_DN2876_c1_g1::TRINITY_DN2876_c1_g1_i1::g.171346::m.171346
MSSSSGGSSCSADFETEMQLLHPDEEPVQRVRVKPMGAKRQAGEPDDWLRLPPGWLMATLPADVCAQIKAVAVVRLVLLLLPVRQRIARRIRMDALMGDQSTNFQHQQRPSAEELRSMSRSLQLWPRELLTELCSAMVSRVYLPKEWMVLCGCPIDRQFIAVQQGNPRLAVRHPNAGKKGPQGLLAKETLHAPCCIEVLCLVDQAVGRVSLQAGEESCSVWEVPAETYRALHERLSREVKERTEEVVREPLVRLLAGQKQGEGRRPTWLAAPPADQGGRWKRGYTQNFGVAVPCPRNQRPHPPGQGPWSSDQPPTPMIPCAFDTAQNWSAFPPVKAGADVFQRLFEDRPDMAFRRYLKKLEEREEAVFGQDVTDVVTGLQRLHAQMQQALERIHVFQKKTTRGRESRVSPRGGLVAHTTPPRITHQAPVDPSPPPPANYRADLMTSGLSMSGELTGTLNRTIAVTYSNSPRMAFGLRHRRAPPRIPYARNTTATTVLHSVLKQQRTERARREEKALVPEPPYIGERRARALFSRLGGPLCRVRDGGTEIEAEGRHRVVRAKKPRRMLATLLAHQEYVRFGRAPRRPRYARIVQPTSAEDMLPMESVPSVPEPDIPPMMFVSSDAFVPEPD